MGPGAFLLWRRLEAPQFAPDVASEKAEAGDLDHACVIPRACLRHCEGAFPVQLWNARVKAAASE